MIFLKRVIRLPILFLLVFCSKSILAQDSLYTHLPEVWTLKECIDFAKQNNISINSLKLNAKSVEQDVIAAKSAAYPNLSASVSQGLVNSKSGTQTSSGYGINSDVLLLNGGYLKNNIKYSQLNQQVTNLSVEAAKNDITIQITQAFLNILLAKESIVYLSDLFRTSEAQVKQGEQFLSAGAIANKELLQLKATSANDQYSLVTAQNQLQQNTLMLKQLLQLPSDVLFTVSTIDTAKVTTPLMALSSAQGQALLNRPEIKGAELSVQLQNLQLEKTKASIRPSLSLGGSLNDGFNSSNLGSYYNQLSNGFNQSLGLTLSIPIWDRNITKTTIEKAKLSIRQSQLTLIDTKIGLTQAIETAYLNVQNANSQYEAAKQQFKYTGEALRIAEEELRIGINNNVEYLQQKSLYVQALQAYIQAKYSANLFTKIYNFYTGIPVAE